MRSRFPRTITLLSLLAAGALLALTGCGGGGNSGAAKDLIDKAFRQPIHSANVGATVEASVQGVSQLQQPIRFKVTGPYQTNGSTKLPSLNWQLNFQGGGQAFAAGATSTGDNLFINFQGQSYEVGKAQVAQLNRQLATQSGQRRSLSSFGIDPRDWIKDPQEKGDQTVDGVATTHVQAGIDVKRMLGDFNKLLSKAGSIGAAAGAPGQIPKSVIDQAGDIVKNPKFDLYVGKSDSKIRRLALAVDFSVPKDDQGKVGGLKSGTLSFTIDFSNVGQPQTIKAPANAKPISELTSQLGGLGGLGGVGSGGSSAPGGSGGSKGSGPSSAQFQKYSKCVQQANPGDVKAIQKCAQLLK